VWLRWPIIGFVAELVYQRGIPPTEGFDTADLKEARVLLEELGA
jgi:hypothetical protein